MEKYTGSVCLDLSIKQVTVDLAHKTLKINFVILAFENENIFYEAGETFDSNYLKK